MSPVDVSVVMPVFNTGDYLNEAVESVLQQKARPGEELPTYELLIVDDGSTDEETRAILARYANGVPKVRVIKNERTKGVSGARNTGIMAALGRWIGFLDSDDTWFSHALAVRWSLIQREPSAIWVGGHHYQDKPGIGIERTSLAVRSPYLYSLVGRDHDLGRPCRLARPVALFAKHCAVHVLTVLILREMAIAKGMFDEDLPRAEDYHFWLKCSVDQDLWLVSQEIGTYRLRPGSLTHGKEPVFYQDHRMLEKLLRQPEFAPYATLLKERFDTVYADYCHYYRRERMYGRAVRWALQWIGVHPMNASAWKQLLAAALRIS